MYDTIAAIATPFGIGGIGVIKISGKDAKRVGLCVFKPKRKVDIKSHRLYYGNVFGKDGKMIDEVLFSYMKAPHTYTREDVVEIYCHSGYAVLKRVLEVVLASGARLAEPGEFTKRAFLNGRIDLLQAEAVLDIVNAKSEKALDLATGQLSGELSSTCETIKERLVDLIATCEFHIDFPDESGEIDYEPIRSNILSIAEEIKKLISTYELGNIHREGISIVICGRPNVGKSSLLNRILKKERAIVSKYPGTTRDFIEEPFFIKGLPVRVIDTAGIRVVGEEVESLGIEFAKKKLREADIVIFVLDAKEGITDDDRRIWKEVAPKRSIVALNKIDLPKSISRKDVEREFKKDEVLEISALRGEGIESLLDLIHDLIVRDIEMIEIPFSINARHKACLEQAFSSILEAEKSIDRDEPPEILAFELKKALDKILEILGKKIGDEVLDSLFRRFCVGK